MVSDIRILAGDGKLVNLFFTVCGAATLTIDPAMPASQNSAPHWVPKTGHMAEGAVLFILHFAYDLVLLSFDL